MEPQLNC